MAWVFDGTNIFKFVINSFDNRLFPEQYLVLQRFSVVSIAGSYNESQNFAFVIDHIVQLEAEEITNGRFSSLGYSIKHFMPWNSFAFINTNWGWIHIRNAGTFAQTSGFQEYRHRENSYLHQFGKPIVWYGFRKITWKIRLNVIQIKMLNVFKWSKVKQKTMMVITSLWLIFGFFFGSLPILRFETVLSNS